MNKDKEGVKGGVGGSKSKDDVHMGGARGSGKEVWAVSELVHIEVALFFLKKSKFGTSKSGTG